MAARAETCSSASTAAAAASGTGSSRHRGICVAVRLLWVAALLAGLPACAAQQPDEQPPGLLELTADTFAPALKELPEDRWVLMEFYAHWCPACQRFQPEYEKVAAQFAARGEQEPVVTVARVDCANHGATCELFKIHGFPTIKLGTAADLAATALDRLTDVQLKLRTAGGVVAFVEKHLDAKLSLPSGDSKAAGSTDDAAAAATSAKEATAAVAAVAGGRKGGAGLVAKGGAAAGRGAAVGAVFGPHVDLHDVEGATITSWRFLASSPLLLKGAEARQALKDWVELLADNHPVERCQKGAQRVRSVLDTYWPDDQEEPAKTLDGLHICPGTDFKEWSSCRGSTPEGRGYTCGLWQLFHTLATRLPDSENAGAVWLAGVKGFVSAFFQCAECAKHFVRHAEGEEAVAVATKRDAVLWLWRTHNIVNRRLGNEEAADPSKFDPAAAHVQFPPPELCSKCRREGGQSDDEGVAWQDDAVYAFLQDFYSGQAAAVDAATGGLRGRWSSWGDAGLVVVLVGACLYAVLRRSGQYALKKSSSRIL